MTRNGFVMAVCLSVASVALLPAHAQENGIARGSPHGHQLGSFGGAQAVARALLGVLHQRLGITAAQEPAWQAFADAVATQAGDADTGLAQAGALNNAVDALNLQASVLRKQADDAAAVARTFTALYAVLTPAQRAITDSYFKAGLAL